jgi:hypothetical protein
VAKGRLVLAKFLSVRRCLHLSGAAWKEEEEEEEASLCSPKHIIHFANILEHALILEM